MGTGLPTRASTAEGKLRIPGNEGFKSVGKVELPNIRSDIRYDKAKGWYCYFGEPEKKDTVNENPMWSEGQRFWRERLWEWQWKVMSSVWRAKIEVIKTYEKW